MAKREPLLQLEKWKVVFPMDVYPMQLIKECLIGDIEKMEKLGIYEVSLEDFGLIDYSSSSKIEAQNNNKRRIRLFIQRNTMI